MLGLPGREERPWASHLSPAPRIASKCPEDTGPQRLHLHGLSTPFHCLRVPRSRSTANKAVLGAGPAASSPTPHPHTEPIVCAQGPTQAHCCPFTGTGHPGGGPCQGVHPPLRASSGVGPLTPFLPRRCRVCGRVRTSPFSREKEVLPFGTKQVTTAGCCVSACGEGLRPFSASGSLAQASGVAQRPPTFHKPS